MKVELSDEEAGLLRIILLGEIEDKRVEMRHATNMDFKEELAAREKRLQGILDRL
jgi:hypothetical protein